MDAIGQIKQLQAQMMELREKAKEEALAKVHAALEELNSLGFNFTVTEKGVRAGKPAKAGKVKRPLKDADCPVCGFKTSPPHDRRAHRHMENPDKPFTKKQLEDKGLTRV